MNNPGESGSVAPFPRGPYLTVAAICESVIEAKDGALSLIRLIDRVMTQASGPDAPEQMPEFPYPLTVVISLKSGEARGTVSVRIEVEQPSGFRVVGPTLTAVLEGEDRGQNLILRFPMIFRDQGLYWFNVYVEDVMVTRIPWRVIYTRTTLPGPILPGP